MKTTYYGVKWPPDGQGEHGEVLYREFAPKAGESWLWVDEELVLPETASVAEIREAVLEGEHEPEVYTGYEVRVGEQPIIMTTPEFDHLILPNFDLDSAATEVVSLIVRTDSIETRHAGTVPLLSRLRSDATFVARSVYERTSAFLFVSILQQPLNQLDARLFVVVEDVGTLEEQIAGRNVDRAEALLGLMRLRGDLAGLRKLFDAHRRVVDALFDTNHGAFGERLQCRLNAAADESRRHFTRLADRIDRSLRRCAETIDTVSALEALLRAQQSDDLNKVLLVLTIASTCSVPLIFITGFFGMNVHFPGRDAAGGLALAVGLMLLFSVPLWFVMFRWIKRKWHGRG